MTRKEQQIIRAHYPHLKLRFRKDGTVEGQKSPGSSYGLLYTVAMADGHIRSVAERQKLLQDTKPSAQIDKSTAFAERINPRNFNFSPKLAAIVGAIIGHDYGVRDGRGGYLTSISITSDGYVLAGSTASDGGGAFIGSADDLDSNLNLYKADLTADDRAQFERIYLTRVKDWR